MVLVDLIEKLINEHGSSVILRERLILLKDQFVALENQILVFRNESISLKEKISLLESENQNLNLENSTLKKKIDNFHNLNPNNYSCDECGSNNLKRTGSVPNKTFKGLGIKDAVFTCNDCGKESFFIVDSK